MTYHKNNKIHLIKRNIALQYVAVNPLLIHMNPQGRLLTNPTVDTPYRSLSHHDWAPRTTQRRFCKVRRTRKARTILAGSGGDRPGRSVEEAGQTPSWVPQVTGPKVQVSKKPS